ncbi:hypothetical protein MTR67_026486 [Solanum verrucosum]|uniref:Uncharacterized protein n=1 Tax=Solanum verrucosum TaxID=315347 RepID=A0AAF0R7A7_SOLVR|nr:hypothetical protein MTR67_026486 [Solanum verrucosum]
MLCDICCTEPSFCQDCCCILCYKLIHLDYVAWLGLSKQGSINLDPEYFCQYYDSMMDLVSHVAKLLSIYNYVASCADIEMIVNVGI